MGVMVMMMMMMMTVMVAEIMLPTLVSSAAIMMKSVSHGEDDGADHGDDCDSCDRRTE